MPPIISIKSLSHMLGAKCGNVTVALVPSAQCHHAGAIVSAPASATAFFCLRRCCCCSRRLFASDDGMGWRVSRSARLEAPSSGFVADRCPWAEIRRGRFVNCIGQFLSNNKSNTNYHVLCGISRVTYSCSHSHTWTYRIDSDTIQHLRRIDRGCTFQSTEESDCVT